VRLSLVVLLALAPLPALAQDVSFSLGGNSLSATGIGLFVLLTLLALAPGIAVSITCFPLIVTVFSILRQGLGLPQAPPNVLIIGLSIFLTWFVMEPVFMKSWQDGAGPAWRGELPVEEAFEPAYAPFKTFMEARTDPDNYARMAALRGADPDIGRSSLAILIPTFMLSEIGRAFQIGFVILLPFLIIDLVVSAILMSMGMMMMPPAIVSLPIKLGFFVVANGWTLLSEALVKGYM
jgi:flagellar biosynthetic protein FliP